MSQYHMNTYTICTAISDLQEYICMPWVVYGKYRVENATAFIIMGPVRYVYFFTRTERLYLLLIPFTEKVHHWFGCHHN